MREPPHRAWNGGKGKGGEDGVWEVVCVNVETSSLVWLTLTLTLSTRGLERLWLAAVDGVSVVFCKDHELMLGFMDVLLTLGVLRSSSCGVSALLLLLLEEEEDDVNALWPSNEDCNLFFCEGFLVSVALARCQRQRGHKRNYRRFASPRSLPCFSALTLHS